MGSERAGLIVLAVGVFGLFALSCLLPAGFWSGPFLEDGVESVGWRLVVFGWQLMPLVGPVGLAWLANPLLGAALLCVRGRNYAAATVISGIALGLSLLPLILLPNSWLGKIQLQPMPAWVFREGRLQFRSGYFVWVCSQGLMMLVAARWWYRSGQQIEFREPVSPPSRPRD
jgi:hypothetical protein